MQVIEIDERLVGLNEYINANRRNRYAGATLKRQQEEIILFYIAKSGAKAIREPVTIQYRWREKNRRRDLDNISFAKKFIQDALVKSGVLNNDGWKDIKGFEDEFEVSDVPGVTVVIRPYESAGEPLEKLRRVKGYGTELKRAKLPSEDLREDYFKALRDALEVVEDIEDASVQQIATLKYIHGKTWDEVNKILFCEYGSSDTPRKAVEYYFKSKYEKG